MIDIKAYWFQLSNAPR